MTGRWAVTIGGVIGAVVLAGCAATGPAPGGDTVTVPDLVGRDAVTVDKLVAGAGLVAVVEREPAGQHSPGTVVRLDPAPGTAVARGTTITVVVAGPAGTTVDDIVAADRTTFVGAGVTADGTTVIAIGPGADEQAALARLAPALAGKPHTVRRCGTSWTDLSRIVTEVTARDDLKGTQGFGIAIEPALCAVTVTGDIPPATAEALRKRYGDAIVVTPGAPAARLPRR